MEKKTAPARTTRRSARTRGAALDIDLFNLKTPGKRRRRGRSAAAAEAKKKKKTGSRKKKSTGKKQRGKTQRAKNRRGKARGQNEETESSSEEEDAVRVPPEARVSTASIARPADQSRRWTAEETRALLQGVDEYGEGRWSAILGAFQGQLIKRTATDLRLKYRNLLQASQRRSSSEAGEGKKRSRRRPVPWTPAEVEALENLCERFGAGKWAKMLQAGGTAFNECRTPQDLKDKWRVLQGRAAPSKRQQPKRMYRLLHSDGVVFCNRYPRDAALKAASRGWPRIVLLDLSSDDQTVHIFDGERVERDVKTIRNSQLRKTKFKDQDTFWVPSVTKIGTQSLPMYLKEIRGQKPPAPLDRGRENRGGRPSTPKRGPARRTRSRRAAASGASSRGSRVTVPMDAEEVLEARSDEEGAPPARSIKRIFNGIKFMFSRVAPGRVRVLEAEVAKMGGTVLKSVAQASEQKENTRVVVVAPRPMTTRKVLFSLARGVPSVKPDFIGACMDKRGIANAVQYAIPALKPQYESALPEPAKWTSLKRRKGINPLAPTKRVLYGVNVGSFNLSEEQLAILTATGANVTVVDRISAKLPRNMDCIVSGDYSVFANQSRKPIVSFSWVVECLLSQKVAEKGEAFLCENVDPE